MRAVFVLALAGCSVRDATFTGTGGGDDGGGDDAPPRLELVVSNRGALTVAEGSSVAFTVKLSAMPPSDVTIAVAASGPIAVDPPSLVVTPESWDAAQTVTVTPVSDADYNYASAAIEIAAPGLETKQTPVEVVEPAIIELMPAIANARCAGAMLIGSIRLKGQPIGVLRIEATRDALASNLVATMTPFSFEFDATTFDRPQSFEVVGGVPGDPGGVAYYDFQSPGVTARFRLNVGTTCK